MRPTSRSPTAVQVLDDVMRAMFLAAKAMDTSRPVLDTSGYSHRVPETDVWDSHNYEQDPAVFAVADGRAEPTAEPDTNTRAEPDRPGRCPYSRTAVVLQRVRRHLVAVPSGSPSSGPRGGRAPGDTGRAPASEEEFHTRFAGLTRRHCSDDRLMFGYCYTQLTDVFQEQNGVYSFDRSQKLDVTRVRAAQLRPAAIESAPRERP